MERDKYSYIHTYEVGQEPCGQVFRRHGNRVRSDCCASMALRGPCLQSAACCPLLFSWPPLDKGVSFFPRSRSLAIHDGLCLATVLHPRAWYSSKARWPMRNKPKRRRETRETVLRAARLAVLEASRTALHFHLYGSGTKDECMYVCMHEYVCAKYIRVTLACVGCFFSRFWGSQARMYVQRTHVHPARPILLRRPLPSLAVPFSAGKLPLACLLSSSSTKYG